MIKGNIHAHNNQFVERGEIYTSTIGILFLGTPHMGSGSQKLGDRAAAIAELLLKQPNRQLLSTLSTDSHILEKQRDDFDTISRDLDLVCFYEELPHPGLGLVRS